MSNSYQGISIIGCTTHLQQREKVDEEPQVDVDTLSEPVAAFVEQSSVTPLSAVGACLSAAFGVQIVTSLAEIREAQNKNASAESRSIHTSDV